MRHLAVILALLAGSVAGAVAGPVGAETALVLTLPATARAVLDQVTPEASHDLPIAPFAGFLPVDPREGQVTRRVWQIPGDLPSLRVLAPLRDQLLAAGFTPILACRDMACGGYDFRFATEVAPPPDMQVDLTDFHFLSAGRGEERLSLLVSRAGATAFVQMIHVAPMGTPLPQSARDASVGPGDLSVAGQLLGQGRVVLDDLAFATGAAALGAGPFPSLVALAQFLAENPARRIALVGHTDAMGALDANVALSERRAVAVLERLVSEHGTPRAQIAAHGIGYLAPVQPSTTAAGRAQNRRVEAVLLAAE